MEEVCDVILDVIQVRVCVDIRPRAAGVLFVFGFASGGGRGGVHIYAGGRMHACMHPW